MDGFRDKERKGVEREREAQGGPQEETAGRLSLFQFTAGVPFTQGPGSDTFWTCCEAINELEENTSTTTVACLALFWTSREYRLVNKTTQHIHCSLGSVRV